MIYVELGLSGHWQNISITYPFILPPTTLCNMISKEANLGHLFLFLFSACNFFPKSHVAFPQLLLREFQQYWSSICGVLLLGKSKTMFVIIHFNRLIKQWLWKCWKCQDFFFFKGVWKKQRRSRQLLKYFKYRKAILKSEYLEQKHSGHAH